MFLRRIGTNYTTSKSIVKEWIIEKKTCPMCQTVDLLTDVFVEIAAWSFGPSQHNPLFRKPRGPTTMSNHKYVGLTPSISSSSHRVATKYEWTESEYVNLLQEIHAPILNRSFRTRTITEFRSAPPIPNRPPPPPPPPSNRSDLSIRAFCVGIIKFLAHTHARAALRRRRRHSAPRKNTDYDLFTHA